MKKIINALFLTIITLVTFSCSDVPSPYDITDGGNGGDGPTLTGDGTKENPYDVTSAMSKQDGSDAWVMGYIVGAVNGQALSEDVAFAPPFTLSSNVLIAASATETNYKKCIPVQLVAQTDVRTALNLMDNAANLGKAVVIKGQLTKYFGVAGLKTASAAVLDGKEIGTGGGTDPEPGDKDNPFGLDASNPVNEINADFNEQPDFVQEGTFNSNLNYDYQLAGWKNIAYVGDRKWNGVVFKDNAKYIQASANKGTAAQYECWFISPAFTVNNIKDKKISFDCAGAYYYATTTLKVYFLELVSGVMQKTEVAVNGIPTTGTNFEWTSGLEIDLTPYAGKVGFIGFQYIGEGGASKSTTYQLDNIKSGSSTGGGEDPDPTPSTNLLANPSFETWTADAPESWGRATVTTANSYSKSTDAQAGSNSAVIKDATGKSNIRFGSSEVTLAAGTYVLSTYAKKVGEKGLFKMGYVPIAADGKVGTYTYLDTSKEKPTDAETLTDEWLKYSSEFTLQNEATVSIFLVNAKSGSDILVDNVSLTKK